VLVDEEDEVSWGEGSVVVRGDGWRQWDGEALGAGEGVDHVEDVTGFVEEDKVAAGGRDEGGADAGLWQLYGLADHRRG
jgi:hypothetical protein